MQRVVAFDLTMAPLRPTGGSYYAINLVRALTRQESEFRFAVFARPHTLAQLGDLGPRAFTADVGPLPRWRRYVWEQTGLPLALRHVRAHLLHSPHYTTPYLYSPCPLVVTVHDLRFFLMPERFTPARRLLFQAAVLLSCRRAAALLVPSQSTAEDLRVLAHADPAKIRVTPEGVDPAFRPLDREACRREVSLRHGLPPGYLLSVGTLEPGKNRGAAYRALRRLLDGGHDLHLAVVGGGGWGAEEESRQLQALRLEGRVHFTGYLPQEDLPAIYNAAAVFVFPSLHEGFGLAALEAMACGTPVVAADRASLPEVVGDAGLLVDPRDDAALAAAIEQVLTRPRLAAELAQKGLRRARAFSWDACAARTLEVYRSVLAAE